MNRKEIKMVNDKTLVVTKMNNGMFNVEVFTPNKLIHQVYANDSMDLVERVVVAISK